MLPVIGRELSIVDDEGVPTRYDRAVARRLAADLGVPLAAGAPVELEEVAHAHVTRNPGDWASVCTALGDVMAAYQPAVPAALEKLASLPFRLFLTTTFDDLLLRALGRATTKVHELAPQRSIGELSQLPFPIPAEQRAIYYLLGRPGQPGDFALTEEDTLEIVKKLEIKLETRSLEVAGLAANLDASQLLLLGCGYPDWLLRFFVRTLRRERFREKPERRARVADGAAALGGSLALFLDRYNVPVFLGDPGVFVDTLHKKYSERRGAATAAPATAPAAAPAAPRESPVLVAHGPADRESAARIVKALSDWGVGAVTREWQAAAPAEPPLLASCDVYLAMLSDRALRDIPETALRDEWRAVQERQEAQEGGPFATLMITLDQEAKRRQQRPESRDWPAWPRATVKHSPADEQILEVIAKGLFDAGHLPRPSPSVKLYCVVSDSDEDGRARERLRKQLAQVRFIEASDHIDLPAGSEVSEWKGLLGGADVIAILVTPDVPDTGKDPANPAEPGEIEAAIARHRAGEALVVPLLVRPLFGWRESLESEGAPRLEALPRKGDFLVERPNEDMAWSEAARELVLRIQLHWLKNKKHRAEGPR